MLLPLMAELARVEAEAVLLVCCALLLPMQVLISPRTSAFNAGVEFTVLFGAAKIGWSTGVLAVVVGSLAVSSPPPGRLVSRVLTMSCS